MDFNKMVNESMAKMEAEGKFQEIVNSRIEKTVKDVVDDLFGNWSSFSKDLKENMKEKLQVDFDKLGLQSYNHLILTEIQKKLEDEVTVNGVAQAKSSIEALLSGGKSEYKLSELVKELAEEIEDIDEIGYDEYREITLIVQESDWGNYYISMDSKEDESEYSCKYRLMVSEDGKVLSSKINEDKYGEDKSIENFDIKDVMNGLHGLEETLFKIYTSGAKLIIDEEHCETDISNPEYD